MSVGGKFKDKLNKIKTHLTSLDEQSLGKAALVIILFLDLFILVAIFNGLDDHTKQLTSPDEYIPYSCREIVTNRTWNPTNRIDNLAQIIDSANNSYYPLDEKKNDQHPLCAPYGELLDQIKSDKELSAIFAERDKLAREVRELQGGINNLKGAYDTTLLETIARKEEGQPGVAAIKGEFQEKAGNLNLLKSQIAALEQAINADARVTRLWEKVQGLREEERQSLLSDLRRLNFWYPVKKLGMQLLFLLPLFAVFALWNSASIRKNRGAQILVSTHLLIVAFIPIFCKIIETIYDIIPKKLLKQLIDLLHSLKLVGLWHYLIIAFAIAVALFLIYIFQKKLFSREKSLERRIAKGECQQCGKHLPTASPACPFCGFAQFKVCPHCQQPMHVHGKYCRECGELASVTSQGAP